MADSSSSSFRPSSFSPPTRSLLPGLCRAPSRRSIETDARQTSTTSNPAVYLLLPLLLPAGLGARTVCRPPDRNFGRAGTERRENPPTHSLPVRFDAKRASAHASAGARTAQLEALRSPPVSACTTQTHTHCDEQRLGQPYQDLPSAHPFINSRHLAPWRQAGKASAAAVKDTQRSSAFCYLIGCQRLFFSLSRHRNTPKEKYGRYKSSIRYRKEERRRGSCSAGYRKDVIQLFIGSARQRERYTSVALTQHTRRIFLSSSNLFFYFIFSQ